MRKIIYQILLIIIILSFPFGYLLAQKAFDHEIFLERLRHSSDTIYIDCIKAYDMYLDEFPDDVSVLIEKCKFIQLAQYDEYEDYNPHQAEFDSCVNILTNRFPTHPEVLLFQTTYLWGEDLEEVFKNAEQAIKNNPEEWNPTSLATLYKTMADQYYYDDDYRQALVCMEKAISNDVQYGASLEYARILLKLGKKEEALNALVSNQDTTKEMWQLTQKADLFLELKAYTNALDIYQQIAQIDSTYNNNSNIASTLDGIGQYELAREYLVADTSRSWNKSGALRNLLKHDLKYQDGATCITTYNEFRDLGYLSDPLGFYRLKLFLSHPFQPWKFRDLLGLISLQIALLMLIIMPYVWILPVYFVGHHWNFLSHKKSYESLWGLKTFWFVSVGYLIASFFACMVEPEILYSVVNSSYFNYDTDMTPESRGFEFLVFIMIMALFALAAMYKVNPKILWTNSWSVGKSVLVGIGIFIIFKLLSAFYIQLGVRKFDVSIENLANIPNILLASRQDIEAIISTFGKGTGLLLIGLLAPIYEEIIFRGVILDSCQRYTNFNMANVFQALLFALVHMSWFLAPVFFLFGILTGILRKKSESLFPGIVFHVVNNILALIVIFVR